ncbi:MAG: hypothetical protein Q9195_009083 [Heterodermia aff. obscurata]
MDQERIGIIYMCGLPHAVYRAYETTGFVLTWLENNNVDTAILNDFRSAMKMEELVRKNVILAGDELYLAGQAGKVATVTSFTNRHGINARIAFNGTFIRNGSFEGPSTMLAAMQTAAPAAANPVNRNGSWTEIRVRRQGQNLGSLHDLRQRLNRFNVEMAGWAEVKEERRALGI